MKPRRVYHALASDGPLGGLSLGVSQPHARRVAIRELDARRIRGRVEFPHCNIFPDNRSFVLLSTARR
jgi:hypothetical protein